VASDSERRRAKGVVVARDEDRRREENSDEGEHGGCSIVVTMGRGVGGENAKRG
jgi:hypothetical protein